MPGMVWSWWDLWKHTLMVCWDQTDWTGSCSTAVVGPLGFPALDTSLVVPAENPCPAPACVQVMDVLGSMGTCTLSSGCSTARSLPFPGVKEPGLSDTSEGLRSKSRVKATR